MFVENFKGEDFEKLLKSNNNFLTVLHFCAEWAPQCAQVTDVLKEFSKDTLYINCNFTQVEAEENPDLAVKYKVSAVPTCVFIKNFNVIDSVEGANIPELTKKIKHHGTSLSDGSHLPSASSSVENLNNRLKNLISSAPVMLFMKGSPEEPRCGFSRQTVQILNEQNVKYDTFDILSDGEVRQGLKTFSNWPTYPQLYIKGELIGGIDIIKEMVENGEFAAALPPQQPLDDRLKDLIKKEKVMLFMKGDPTNPRCGFSKTTVGILDELDVKYGHFDILSDNDVRQGLKKFSNWPTYPQLYVNGELIGGLDIIKELKESNELVDVLKG